MSKKTTRKATKKASKKPRPSAGKPKSKPATAAKAAPRLLSGGNPQIPKGHGDTPIQAYIAAMPGWKRDVGLKLDQIITATVPSVQKAVKWNSPLYGIDSQGWFLGIHCYTRYIKVAFFKGASLRPLPPDESKQAQVRYLNIHEQWGSDEDEAQFADWVLQASGIPGEVI